MLPAGTVAGVTCANCTVEIFSDDGNEGAVYEGGAVADSRGVFTFDKGAAFMGPNLTATATDLDGNTSPFSPPVQGTSRSLTLQKSNHLARTQIQPRHSDELADNRMGMGAAFQKGGVSKDWVERSKNRVGITMHLGMDVITGFGGSEPWRYEQQAQMRVARNLATIMVGVRAASLPVQIQTTLTNTVSYTFALGDDKLVGLWSDGIATEYDPGVASTLIIPGLGDYAVTGLDVLFGYRQPIISENVDGNLVIRDLLVMDYPILLRLSAP